MIYNIKIGDLEFPEYFYLSDAGKILFVGNELYQRVFLEKIDYAGIQIFAMKKTSSDLRLINSSYLNHVRAQYHSTILCFIALATASELLLT